eukprot:31480-Pelagococcus_subviridis.AAC.10
MKRNEVMDVRPVDPAARRVDANPPIDRRAASSRRARGRRVNATAIDALDERASERANSQRARGSRRGAHRGRGHRRGALLLALDSARAGVGLERASPTVVRPARKTSSLAGRDVVVLARAEFAFVRERWTSDHRSTRASASATRAARVRESSLERQL